MIKKWNRTLWVLLCILVLAQSVSATQLLIPGGQVIGLALSDNTVTVAAFDPDLGKAAKASGLQVGDTIVEIDEIPIRSAEDVKEVLRQSDGTVQLSVLRQGKRKQLRLEPEVTAEGPKMGVYLKQGVTGVGTVTWYDPDSGTFGALGHSVNNCYGEQINMTSGQTYPATVLSVKKGASGEPGQLLGTLTDTAPTGTLSKNTPQGVFGTSATGWPGEPLPIADSEEIRTGPATIRSTVSGNTVREYSVEIQKIYPSARTQGRNMLLRITDPALLSATGGIVQGMSGSPIIQDGKLVGAVTHVLVNDPTTGYGIFVENMLDAAA